MVASSSGRHVCAAKETAARTWPQEQDTPFDRLVGIWGTVSCCALPARTKCAPSATAAIRATLEVTRSPGSGAVCARAEFRALV